MNLVYDFIESPPRWSTASPSKYDCLRNPVRQLVNECPEKTLRVWAITAREARLVGDGARRLAQRLFGAKLRTLVGQVDGKPCVYIALKNGVNGNAKRKPEMTAIQSRQAADPERTAELKANLDRRNSEVRPRVICEHCHGEYVAVEKERGQWHPYVHRIQTPRGRTVCPGCAMPGELVP